MGRPRGRSRRGRPAGFRTRGNAPVRHIPEMKVVFPDFVSRIARDGSVTWFGSFQPNPSSATYRLKVNYGLYGSPRVWVLSPELDADAPHRWPEGDLCLYWPREWTWSDRESIAQTIMGWAAIWLEYYEIWKVLGEWHGPSSHNEFPEEEDAA